ncbi:MAG: hypothetical protein V1899_02880 [Planctomycetota bacterium]
MSYAFNRRDKAEPRYLAIYKQHGGTWQFLQRDDGADILLFCNFDLRIVEHKSSPRWELTEVEQGLRTKCLLAGVPYEIVDSEYAARVLILDMRGEHMKDLSQFQETDNAVSAIRSA